LVEDAPSERFNVVCAIRVSFLGERVTSGQTVEHGHAISSHW
jgi:hypothetical protein